jgi:hypothetical protein
MNNPKRPQYYFHTFRLWVKDVGVAKQSNILGEKRVREEREGLFLGVAMTFSWAYVRA